MSTSPPAMAPGPFFAYAAVTPSDTVDLGVGARSFYVGVAGDIAVAGFDNTVVLFKAVPVGVLPISARRINATNTTATNIVALV
jgi:hypothetical protein